YCVPSEESGTPATRSASTREELGLSLRRWALKTTSTPARSSTDTPPEPRRPPRSPRTPRRVSSPIACDSVRFFCFRLDGYNTCTEKDKTRVAEFDHSAGHPFATANSDSGVPVDGVRDSSRPDDSGKPSDRRVNGGRATNFDGNEIQNYWFRQPPARRPERRDVKHRQPDQQG